MRFGCCVSTVEQITILARAGFDFCELPAASLLPLEEDDAAEAALEAIASAPLKPESFNSLVPAHLKLVGPNRDLIQLQHYFQRTFDRMAQLGAQVAVLGSGGARQIPNGYPWHTALVELEESFRLAGEIAHRAGIELALEHLNHTECNVFNTVKESREFILKRNLPMSLLVDLHHIEVEQEPLSDVIASGSLIAHVHVAGGGRRSPDTPGYDLFGFFQALRATGYRLRISAENGWDNLELQAASALAHMRQVWDASAS